MKRIYDIIWALFHPGYWVSNSPASSGVDSWILEQIKNKAKVKYLGNHTVLISEKVIWAANFPYDYGSIGNSPLEALPYRRTRKLLFEYITDPRNVE